MILENNIIEMKDRLSEYKDKISGKTFVITGGAGFLGKNIVWALQKVNEELINKCKIIVLDNYITGIENEFEIDGNIKCIKHDITDKIEINEDIDYILHAAGIASPLFYSKYKLETMKTTIDGTQHVLDMAIKNNCESVLFFSTSEIYGSPSDENIPTPESFNGNVSCTGPRAHYDESKRLAETLCVTHHDIFNVNVKIVRPFNVYGPGMRLDDGRGLINICKCAILNEELPVYDMGTSTRTWTYITDAVIGFMKVLFSDENGEAFNVGTDVGEISTIDLARLTKKLSNSQSKLTLMDAPIRVYKKEFDVLRRCPDISKIRERLQFEPDITLESGLQQTIDWIKEELNI